MRQRGFTLLEVLVATLIMAIAVGGVLTQLASSSKNVSKLTEYDRAVILARQKMDEIILAAQFPATVPLEGVWKPEETGSMPAGWRAAVTPFEAPPQAAPGTPILERIQLEVWWAVDRRRKTFQLEGYRRRYLKPEDLRSP